jgi:integrase
MKDRKLRVRVSCTNKDFYLEKPVAGADWHIRFTPPRDVREALGIRERVSRTTGLAELEPAKQMARRIIESYWPDATGNVEAVIDRARKQRKDVATIGEILALAPVSPKTKTALRRMIAVVHGGDPDLQRATVLDASLVRQFEMCAKVNSTSVASYVRQAKSIFSHRRMRFYTDLVLPDLTGFRSEQVERPPIVDLEPPDLNVLRAMDAAAPALAESDPAVYVAHLLFSRLAMRNCEILAARESWIVDGRIGLIRRPNEHFKPKGRSGWLPVAPDVVTELARFSELRTDGFLVMGENQTQRYDAIYRRHSRWVSRWITDGTKTSYELRRYAGSRLLDMGASMLEVRDFLRHRNIQTTERWYAYRLQNRELPTIGMTNLVPSLRIVA